MSFTILQKKESKDAIAIGNRNVQECDSKLEILLQFIACIQKPGYVSLQFSFNEPQWTTHKFSNIFLSDVNFELFSIISKKRANFHN